MYFLLIFQSICLIETLTLLLTMSLGTKPFFIPRYRMALVELKEIKDQLQGLLSKVFFLVQCILVGYLGSIC